VHQGGIRLKVATYWAIGYVCLSLGTLTLFLAVAHLYRLATNGPLNSSHLLIPQPF
jgi:hypothetical protein